MVFKGITEKVAEEFEQRIRLDNRIYAVEQMGRVLTYLKAIRADDLAKKAAELGDAIAVLPPPKEPDASDTA